MGMEVGIQLDAPGEAIARAAATRAFAEIARLDGLLSDYRPDSDVRAVAAAAPSARVVAPEVIEVLELAMAVARATGGAFDPTMAPVGALWRAARLSGNLPSAEEMTAARALVGWQRVQIDRAQSTVRLPVAGMTLDLGGIAKGYILQRAITALRAAGARGLITAGGDIVASEPRRGSQGWAVQIGCAALADRRGTITRPVSVALLDREALATSGDTAQFVVIDGVRYSHVVDPATGLGLTDHRTVHVRAPDGTTADAWATALSVLGPERSRQVDVPPGVRFCFVDAVDRNPS
jgi:FAD:protein FMN transferase